MFAQCKRLAQKCWMKQKNKSDYFIWAFANVLNVQWKRFKSIIKKKLDFFNGANIIIIILAKNSKINLGFDGPDCKLNVMLFKMDKLSSDAIAIYWHVPA